MEIDAGLGILYSWLCFTLKLWAFICLAEFESVFDTH